MNRRLIHWHDDTPHGPPHHYLCQGRHEDDIDPAPSATRLVVVGKESPDGSSTVLPLCNTCLIDLFTTLAPIVHDTPNPDLT